MLCVQLGFWLCVTPIVGMCVDVVGQGCCMGMIVQPLMCGYEWIWLIVWVLLGNLMVVQ